MSRLRGPSRESQLWNQTFPDPPTPCRRVRAVRKSDDEYVRKAPSVIDASPRTLQQLESLEQDAEEIGAEISQINSQINYLNSTVIATKKNKQKENSADVNNMTSNKYFETPKQTAASDRFTTMSQKATEIFGNSADKTKEAWYEAQREAAAQYNGG